MFADSGLSNYRKQPRLQAGLAAKTRFAFKDLQIDRLQNFFGFCPVTAATTQGPAETSAVERFQFSLKLRDVHSVYRSVYSHGFGPVFEVLVVRAGELYDSDAENVRQTPQFVDIFRRPELESERMAPLLRPAGPPCNSRP